MSLDVKASTLKTVLKLIEDQSNFRFFYNSDLVDLDKEINGSFSNKTIDEILRVVLAGTSVGYRVMDNNFVVLSSAEVLQQITITGTVTDAAGEPLPGVNVVVKGTLQGTATNFSGAYSIAVPDANATLVFSFVGFANQEIAVGNQRIINVTLYDDASQIEEVVVIGYGSIKKANLTGAVGYIDNKQLENRAVTSATQALQGKVAGLNVQTGSGVPGGEQKLNLRGFTGLGVMGDPLIIIDGIQSPSNALSFLEMNDVESISFLKDAASAAIYGSSAPYGVVLVTTKKGRAGKPVITYNNNFGFSRPMNMPHWRSSIEVAEMYNYAAANAGNAPIYSAEQMDRIRRYAEGTLKEETWANADNSDWVAFWGGGGNANNDWFDILLNKTSFGQRHNISASGATDNTNYYVGLGYTQQDGLITLGREDDKRYNARVNVSTNLTSWLTFSVRTSFSRQNVELPGEHGMIGNTQPGANTIQAYAYGIINDISKTVPNAAYRTPDGGIAEYGPASILAGGGRRYVITDNYSFTGEFVVKPLPGWDITGNYTYAGREFEAFNHSKTYYITRPNGQVTPSGRSVPNSLWRQFEKNRDYTVNVFSSYEKSLGSHYLKGTIGFSQMLNTWLWIRAQNNTLLDDQTPMLSLTSGNALRAEDNAWEYATRGVFGRIQYNFQEKYLLELNGRYDGTSKYMKDYRMKFYPGASAAWVASRESFWEPLTNYVNQFKLRVSYASLGDQNSSGRYDFYPALRSTQSTSTRWFFSGNARENYFIQPANMVNPSISWVTMNTLGFGFDLAAVNNRFEFSFDWFRRLMKDYLGPSGTYSDIMAVNPPDENNTDLLTKGFEITLGWKDRRGDFSYGATLILSDFTGKVLKYPNEYKGIYQNYEGKTQGEIWGFKTVGLIKTDEEAAICRRSQTVLGSADWQRGDVHFKAFSDDGVLTRGALTLDDHGDLRIIGNNTPRFQYGLTLNAEWKGFDFQVFLQGIGKRDVRFDEWDTVFWGITGWGSGQSCYYTAHDFWTEDNPNGYLPRPNFGTYKNLENACTRYLQNGAYMRVKNIQLGYTIPKTLTDKINFNRARLFVNIENLATFSHMSKVIDPDLAGMQSLLYDGANAKRYPLRRTLSFGLNVTF